MITIVGEAPSRSSDPRRPFCGASGERLAKLAGLGGYGELAAAARLVNVLPRWPGSGNAGEKGSRFPIARAKRAARRVDLGGVAIFAGRRVARAFGISDLECFEWRLTSDLRWVAIIPHPSGCNRFWNYPKNRALAARFLEAAIPRPS